MSTSLGSITNLTVSVEEHTWDTHIASEDSTPDAERVITIRLELLLKDGAGRVLERARTVERVAEIAAQLTGDAKISAENFKPIRRYTAAVAESKEPGISTKIIQTHDAVVIDQKVAEKTRADADAAQKAADKAAKEAAKKAVEDAKK